MSTSKGPTSRQFEYLKFIETYIKLENRSPSESDTAAFFGVAGPSVHQMFVTLKSRGFVHRRRGLARSITPVTGVIKAAGKLDVHQIRCAQWPGGSTRPETAIRFVQFLVDRTLSSSLVSNAKYAVLLRLSLRAEPFLVKAGVSAQDAKAALLAHFATLKSENESGTRSKAGSGILGNSQPARKRQKPVDPNQLTLF